MKTIEEAQSYLQKLKDQGKFFSPLSQLFFNKNTRRLTVHGYVVANMMWDGIEKVGDVPHRVNECYIEFECPDGYVEQAEDLLDKQSDLCYFIDAGSNNSDSGKLILKCFGDVKSFNNLLKLSNGDFLDCVKKMPKKRKK